MISRQVASLEAELGARLFHRVPQGAVLTEAGQAFLDKVADMPAQAATAVHHARQAARGETGILRLGFVSTVASRKLSEWLHGYREQHPDVELQLFHLTSAQQAAALQEGSIDAGALSASTSYPVLRLPEHVVLADVLEGQPPVFFDLVHRGGAEHRPERGDDSLRVDHHLAEGVHALNL